MASFSMFNRRINVRHHSGALSRENSVCLNKFQSTEFIITFSAVQTRTSETLMMEWPSEGRVKKAKSTKPVKEIASLKYRL